MNGRRRSVEDVLRDLEEHMREEAKYPDRIHPDGCYYCGCDHPSDCCLSEEREWFYQELRGEP
jgi:hypothetical protein